MRRLPALLLPLLLTACTGGTEPEPAAGGLPVPPDAQEAVVVSVVDGDTLRLRGRGAGPVPGDATRVRVLLVDTPEVGEQQECFGPEAAARTEELVPRGSVVRVLADVEPRDRFDRLLLHVWTGSGVNLGEALVAEGYATVLQLEPNRRYLAAFEAAQDRARADGRGLWSAC